MVITLPWLLLSLSTLGAGASDTPPFDGAALGRSSGEAGFDARHDLNGDGVVNVLDLAAHCGLGPAAAQRSALGGGTEAIVIEPLSVSAAPEDMVTMTFLIQGNTVPLLGYSLDIEIVPQFGATGTVSGNASLTNFFDPRNLITAAGATRHPLFSVIQDNGGGSVFVNTLTDDNSTVVAVDAVNDVLAEVIFDVSANATGTFDVVLGAATALSDGAASAVAYSFVPGTITVSACDVAADCCDLDANTVRDDGCTWCACADGCNEVALDSFADMGGAFGACPTDGFANVHDRNHALSCFSGVSTCETINIDAGGAFGACPPDGFCNIHDANHALASFAGTSTCSCPSGPAPTAPSSPAGTVALRLEATRGTIRPGETLAIHAFIDSADAVLRGYQLEALITGGHSGQLEIVDITLDHRADDVFWRTAEWFDAFNVARGQMLRGLDADTGFTPAQHAYLATFVVRAQRHASGSFLIDIRTDPTAQTYFIAPGAGEIRVDATTPAVVGVDSAGPGHWRRGGASATTPRGSR